MATKIWVGTTGGSEGDLSEPANWQPSGVPVASDNIYFDGGVSNQDVTTTLDHFTSSPAFSSVHVLDTYTGKIGQAATPMSVHPGDLFLHELTGIASTTGSQRLNFDIEDAACNVICTGSSSVAADAGSPPIRIIGSHSSNTLTVSGDAYIGVAIGPGESAEYTTINTALNQSGIGPTLLLGSGCTLTTVEMGGGTITNRGSNITTLGVSNAKYISQGSCTHTLVNIMPGGAVEHNSSGTITTLTIAGNGSFDLSADGRAKTITNATVAAGCTMNLNNGNPLSVTFTNGIDISNAAVEDITLISTPNINIQFAAV